MKRWYVVLCFGLLFPVLLFLSRRIFFEGSIRDFAASHYVHHLKDVDEIEICALGREAPPNSADLFEYADAYGVAGRQTVRGTTAAEIASLWRSLPTGEHRSMCLDPAYGLRFRSRGREILKTSVCWECEGLVVPAFGGGSVICGFDAYSAPAQKLLESLQKQVPLSPSHRPHP